MRCVVAAAQYNTGLGQEGVVRPAHDEAAPEDDDIGTVQYEVAAGVVKLQLAVQYQGVQPWEGGVHHNPRVCKGENVYSMVSCIIIIH